MITPKPMRAMTIAASTESTGPAALDRMSAGSSMAPGEPSAAREGVGVTWRLPVWPDGEAGAAWIRERFDERLVRPELVAPAGDEDGLRLREPSERRDRSPDVRALGVVVVANTPDLGDERSAVTEPRERREGLADGGR